jgi:hypothetical protein
MGLPIEIIKKVIEKVAPRLVPREGKLEDGTLNGPAARKERGIKEAQEIEKKERANRTG